MTGNTFRTLVIIGAIALGGAYAENRRQAARRREESIDENIKRLAGIVCQVGTEADKRLDHMGRHVAELEERDARRKAEDEAVPPSGFMLGPRLLTAQDYLELGRAGHAALSESVVGALSWAEMSDANRLEWERAARAVVARLAAKSGTA